MRRRKPPERAKRRERISYQSLHPGHVPFAAKNCREAPGPAVSDYRYENDIDIDDHHQVTDIGQERLEGVIDRSAVGGRIVGCLPYYHYEGVGILEHHAHYRVNHLPDQVEACREGAWDPSHRQAYY